MVYIKMPEDVRDIIDRLNLHGFEAFIVGGCVRDSLLKKTPNDWDITTNAKPKDIIRIFEKTVPTGIKHGTVTVLIKSNSYEVTTYRIDGEYTDKRRPDSVEFSNEIVEDLMRRDFTINSIAYNGDKGLVDPFNGYSDITNKQIKCVGKANDRFEEDALRMLRAVRFSSQLNFELVKDTYTSIINKAHLIKEVSNERIQVELNKILISDSSKVKLLKDTGLLYFIMPEICELDEVEQNTPYHKYNVLEHTLFAVDAIENKLVLKLAMLLHDTGKAVSKTTDKRGIDHFYGHAKASVNISRDILNRLKYDNNTKRKIVTLVAYHDCKLLPDKVSIKKLLNKLGNVELFRDLLKIKWADTLAKNPKYIKSRILELIDIERILEDILENKECFCIKDLAINGSDLIEIGYKGKEIGTILNRLLEMVIQDPELNDRNRLEKLTLLFQ
jgi:tRNA nucleotidyltransferase (CCA-adding enzyme)